MCAYKMYQTIHVYIYEANIIYIYIYEDILREEGLRKRKCKGKGIEGKSNTESKRLMRRQELNGAQNTAGGFRVKH